MRTQVAPPKVIDHLGDEVMKVFRV